MLSPLFSPNIVEIPVENFRNTGKLKGKFPKYKTAKGYLSNVGKIWKKFSDVETKIRRKLRNFGKFGKIRSYNSIYVIAFLWKNLLEITFAAASS